MRASLVLLCVLAGCAGLPPRSASELVCSADTKRSRSADSDQGWGEVEATDGCERADQTLQGWAIEIVASAPRQGSTQLVGRYANGRRVGVWRQYDVRTGVRLGTFSLDASGSGLEIIRDQLGHVRRGSVVVGKREGEWRYFDRDGAVVATETWSHGVLVGRSTPPAWNAPMLSPDDACSHVDDTADRDGCPVRRSQR